MQQHTNDVHSTAIVLQYNKLTTAHSSRPLSLFCGGFVMTAGGEREHTGTDSAKKRHDSDNNSYL